MRNQTAQIFSEIERQKIVKAAKNSLRSEEGQKALQYLKDERGLSDSVIEQFQFGYCPETIDHSLRGRIITPIYDVYNNLVAISSRHLDVNHPNRFWHESFDKGSYLYGLPYAVPHILKYQKAIVVEGEMDVAFLHSHGFCFTVGVIGSAFTFSQAALLARYCSEVYFLFDGDQSGIKAYERVQNLYNKYYFDAYNLNYIQTRLPDKTDPDDFLKNMGQQKLKELFIEAKEKKELWNQ